MYLHLPAVITCILVLLLYDVHAAPILQAAQQQDKAVDKWTHSRLVRSPRGSRWLLEPLDANQVKEADSLSSSTEASTTMRSWLQSLVEKESDQVKSPSTRPTITIAPTTVTQQQTGTSRQGTESGFMPHIIPRVSPIFEETNNYDEIESNYFEPLPKMFFNGVTPSSATTVAMPMMTPPDSMDMNKLLDTLDRFSPEYMELARNIGRALVKYLVDYMRNRPDTGMNDRLHRLIKDYMVNHLDPARSANVMRSADGMRNDADIPEALLQRRRHRYSQGLPPVGVFEARLPLGLPAIQDSLLVGSSTSGTTPDPTFTPVRPSMNMILRQNIIQPSGTLAVQQQEGTTTESGLSKEWLQKELSTILSAINSITKNNNTNILTGLQEGTSNIKRRYPQFLLPYSPSPRPRVTKWVEGSTSTTNSPFMFGAERIFNFLGQRGK